MQDIKKKIEPIVLVILDGWGISGSWSGNAIRQAKPQTFTRLWHEYPHRVLQAFAPIEASASNFGSSDIGHASIGSGRLVYSDVSDLNLAIQSGDFYKSLNLVEMFDYVKQNRVTLHLIGLVSPGGVHGHINHLLGVIEAAKQARIESVAIHAITDGIDTPDHTAQKFLKQFNQTLTSSNIYLASVSGRNFVMNLNNQTKLRTYYRTLIGKTTIKANSIDDIFANNLLSDSEIIPTQISDNKMIRSQDAVLILNTRGDRIAPFVCALADSRAYRNFGLFRKEPYLGVKVWTMTDYGLKINSVKPLFKSVELKDTLSEILANHDIHQAKISSPEHLPHVTKFFNGGRNEAFANEDWVSLTHSQNTISIFKKIIEKREHQFIVVNFDTTDRIAHTGNLDATIDSVKSIDSMLGDLNTLVLNAGGGLIITSDHGNAEAMLPISKSRRHTSNGVPYIIVLPENRNTTRLKISQLTSPSGVPDHRRSLADIAPTILELFGIAKPTIMTGRSLIK